VKIGNVAAILIVIFIISAAIVMKYFFDTSHAIVLAGVSLQDAQQKVAENNLYIIVEPEHGATGAEFVIAYGEHKGSEIELSLNSPSAMLSNIFFLSKNNLFLIKTNGNNQNAQNFGIPFDSAYPNIYTIEVEEWRIITPIKRDYQYRMRGQQSRWFSPKYFIDQFDVKNGDYIQFRSH